MNLVELEKQAVAQGGRVIKVERKPWRASNGLVMKEVLASVAVPSSGGFETLRQWASKQGAVEHAVYDLAAEAADVIKAKQPKEQSP